jgi:hypothetical protein
MTAAAFEVVILPLGLTKLIKQNHILIYHPQLSINTVCARSLNKVSKDAELLQRV